MPRQKSTERTKVITVALSVKEKTRIIEMAKEFTLTPGEFVRRAVLGLPIEDIPKRPKVPEVNREIYYNLAEISERLQEIGEACRENEMAQVDLNWLGSVELILNDIRLELIGSATTIGDKEVLRGDSETGYGG